MHVRRDQTDLESGRKLLPMKLNPEPDCHSNRQRAELMRFVLASLSLRDRDILERFYLHEQTQEQICVEMSLSETQFRLLKSRRQRRGLCEIGRKKLGSNSLYPFFMRS